MSGLRKICQQYGSMKIGHTTWVWDYENNEPVKEEEMSPRSERKRASELAKWRQAAQINPLMRP